MYSRSKRLRRLALPLIAGLAMLLTALVAGSAKADPAGYTVIAFQDSNQHLWYYDSAGGHDSGLGMASYSSPSLVFADDVVEIAFQANTNILWGYWPGTNSTINTGLVMGSGTSPSISQTFETAFTGLNYTLMLAQIGVNSEDISNLQISPGTSPSISADGDEVAFQGGNGDLFVYSIKFNTYVDTGLGMESETSPAIGLNNGSPNGSGSQYVVAFQDNHGHLWYYDVGASAHNTGLGMESGTSPTVDPDYTQEMAFQANTGRLWTYNPLTNSSHATGLGLAGGKTWPSIGPYYSPSGAYVGLQVPFSAKTDDYLYTYSTDNNSSVNTGYTLAIDSSPSYSPGASWGDAANEGGGEGGGGDG